MLDKVFEAFEQADNSFAREKQGTGLGLALVRAFVGAHGGRVWLESAPGEGTTAIVARNVVSFRMQYGVSANVPGSTTLADWVDPTGDFAIIDGDKLPRIRALRVGLIVRSTQPEKRDSSGQCTVIEPLEENKPRLWGNPPENLGADWNCWRYRSSTVVVPLRNLVLGQQ